MSSQVLMTAAELRFLVVVAEHGSATSERLGTLVYGGGKSSETYARTTGYVLRRLERRGLVRRRVERWELWMTTYWEVTLEGRKALAEPQV